MIQKVLALIALGSSLLTCNARADLVIEIQDVELVANSVGYIDVLIYSTDSDSFSSFGYDFRITSNNQNSSLAFVKVQAGDNYVFPSDISLFYVSSGEDYGTRILGGDDNGVNVVLDGNKKLLARVEVQHTSDSSDQGVGDEFSLSLWNEVSMIDPTSGTTQFTDSGFDTVALSSGFPVSGMLTSNKITIVALPEPSTWLLLGMAATAFWGTRRLRSLRKS